MQAKRADLERYGLFLRLDIPFDIFTHFLRELQRFAEGVQVAAFHKVVNINDRAADIVNFQRLLLAADTLRQALRIEAAPAPGQLTPAPARQRSPRAAALQYLPARFRQYAHRF